MPAIVTDQFRILNASNFVDSVTNTSNSYYVFLGLSNPQITGFGRKSNWDIENNTPSPIDNYDYMSHYRDTILFGKKIVANNAKRVIRKVSWTANARYDMYRHDYSPTNQTPNSSLSRLYDSNFYVVNSDYRVYICIDNGSSSTLPSGGRSQDEPTFTDLEPSVAGTSGDGYVWKYLFSISPSDIIKFDSTEYIVLPNNWDTSTDTQIQSIREAGNSDLNKNQIKKVYIDNAGSGYGSDREVECDIIGNGTGAKVLVELKGGKVVNTTVTAGGRGYTYGSVDLSSLRTVEPSSQAGQDNNMVAAKLIPIIPPSKGHGYDIYTELGADRVLIYARFDNSNKDFPIDSKFSQVGILKNPRIYSETEDSNIVYTFNQFSSLGSIKISGTPTITPNPGDLIEQNVTGGIAKAYVASYDSTTKVLKYYRDRSLTYANTLDQSDTEDISSELTFNSDSADLNIKVSSILFGTIDTSFGTSSTPLSKDSNGVDLGSTFIKGLSNPEINRKTGDIIYIDNRTSVTRDPRQKEDVKIILEF